jgi:hypothetical protein
VSKRVLRPYVDRGKPGTLRYHGDVLLTVRDPAPTDRVIVTLRSIQRHNTLEPQLQETNRILLRWGESGGTGLPNPEADQRETHYDPLPPDLQERVDDTVGDSPWETLMRKWYRTSLDRKTLAKELRISRTQLYADWRAALWYYRGRFESERIYG